MDTEHYDSYPMRRFTTVSEANAVKPLETKKGLQEALISREKKKRQRQPLCTENLVTKQAVLSNVNSFL